MSAARYVTGWAEVRVRGAEPEKMLRAMAERGIPFWEARPPEDYALTVRVPLRRAGMLPGLAASVGCEAEITAAHGFPAALRRLRRRWPMALLLLGVLALLCASLSRIWYIDVTGNETVPDGVILQALSECGVDVGARWVGLRQDALRNAVLLRVPGLRWMTVTMQGSRAHVIVRERWEPIDPVPEDEYAKVVADKAGFVTSVVAKWGTAEAEENHAILPGETIIGGYATGRFGVQGPARAVGYANVRTWYELTAAAPLAVTEKEYTGAGKARLSLLLGKNRINFYKGSSICPAECDKIIETYALGIKDGFVLPLAVEKTVLVPYSLRTVTAAELRSELETQLMDALLDAIGEDGTVRDSAFTASEADGVLYVTLRAECAERIGVTVPLTEEELWAIQAKLPKTEDETP